MTATTTQESADLFAKAHASLASGVSASMRINPYTGRPLYASRGEGAHIYGLDGTRYIDFNMSNGATMLGHDHPAVKQALLQGVAMGVICAAETPFHERLAARMVEIIPAAERVRFASVGSEATLVALRIARAATGRTRFLKFDGHFHGLTEPWLFKRADPLTDDPTVVPSSGGVPAAMAADVTIVPWNDVAAFERAIAAHGDELAAVVCEPIHYNAGCIPPASGFLDLLRERTREHGIVLIFDEVLSGFRTALGGVQAQYGVTPDLTTHAKALANGLPLSSVSGRADLMELLAPAGAVVHSGTYSGHLLSVLAALATLDELSQPGVYDRINATGDAFYRDLQAVFDRAGVPARVQGMGARFGIYFGRTEPVTTWSDAWDHDHEMNQRFVIGCLERGVSFHGYARQGAPGHAGFSLAHSPEDFAETLTVVETVAKTL
ncbi:MAG: aspartate aminotransferase family protein [Thermomicrobiales bacterium]|nr:aspartate aminotransferase family protein [Thermomicrobiales bacterium]